MAIVAVMGYHLAFRLPHAFHVFWKFGWMGVDLFFVLSGYLIGLQLLRPVQQHRRVDVAGFYRRRAYRILPAYLAVLAFYFVWPRRHEAGGLAPLWQFLTFTENLLVDSSRNYAFSHVWSLCVEEHFYLLLPLLVLWLSRRPSLVKTVVVLAGAALAGMVLRGYLLVHIVQPLAAAGQDFGPKYMELIYYPTWSRLDGLLCGVGMALVSAFRPAWWAAMVRRSQWLMGVGLLFTTVAMWMFYRRFNFATGLPAVGTVLGFPVLSAGLALWLPAATARSTWFGRVEIPGIRMLATLAFSLYLTHKEVASLVHGWLPSFTSRTDWRTVPIYAVSCLLGAALVYFAVERPFLKMRDRRSSKDVDVEARADPAL